MAVRRYAKALLDPAKKTLSPKRRSSDFWGRLKLRVRSVRITEQIQRHISARLNWLRRRYWLPTLGLATLGAVGPGVGGVGGGPSELRPAELWPGIASGAVIGVPSGWTGNGPVKLLHRESVGLHPGDVCASWIRPEANKAREILPADVWAGKVPAPTLSTPLMRNVL